MRDIITTLKYEFEHYDYYRKQKEANIKLYGDWIEKFKNTNSVKYKKECRSNYTLAKLQAERCGRQLHFIENTLLLLPSKERSILKKIYIYNLPKKNLLKELGLQNECDLWLFVNDVFTRLAERLGEKYDD